MAKKSKPSDQKTLVTFLLDRTGSMSSCKDATIEAFNAYIGGLKQDGSPIQFTFLQFDSVSLDKICIAEPVKMVAELNSSTFQPRAATPLIDSCVKTIRAVEESLTKRDDKPKIIICFQTDGYENASTEHTWDELNALIKEKSGLGWQFNFMGAGIDAYANASRMGIMAESAISYDQKDRVATRAAFTASACNTMAFSRGESANTHYSGMQRTSAGDAFAPAGLMGGKKIDKTLKSATKNPIVDKFSL